MSKHKAWPRQFHRPAKLKLERLRLNKTLLAVPPDGLARRFFAVNDKGGKAWTPAVPWAQTKADALIIAANALRFA